VQCSTYFNPVAREAKDKDKFDQWLKEVDVVIAAVGD